MAFQQPNNVRQMPAQNGGNRGGYRNNDRKPDYYLNVSIPLKRKNGTMGQGKLEGIKLYLDNHIHAALVNMFQEDPENAADRLRDALIIEMNEGNVNEGAEVLL